MNPKQYLYYPDNILTFVRLLDLGKKLFRFFLLIAMVMFVWVIDTADLSKSIIDLLNARLEKKNCQKGL